jgi:hypothetical protein
MTMYDPQNDPGALALRRWKLGHKAFHVILEGMLDSISACRASLRLEDYDSLSIGLKKLAFLYRAATSTFRYAAEFDPQLYTSTVRPSMMPPFLPDGFSGTLNIKHREMKEALHCLLKEISPVLPLHETLNQGWQEVLQAKSENMKNHGLVCSRFIPGGRSLLREFYDRKRKEGVNDDSGV